MLGNLLASRGKEISLNNSAAEDRAVYCVRSDDFTLNLLGLDLSHRAARSLFVLLVSCCSHDLPPSVHIIGYAVT